MHYAARLRGISSVETFNSFGVPEPLTDASSTTTSDTPVTLGSWNIVSSKVFSIIDRRPRAPVPLRIEVAAICRTAPSVNVNVTPSIANNF